MGDCVLTTPAIELLKQARPDLEIGVVVEDRFAAIFEGNPAVSTILPPSYTAVHRWRSALSLNLHGGTRSQLLTVASLAPIRAGFGHHRGAIVYSVRIPRAQEVLHTDRTVNTAEHLACAMFYLGVPASDVPRARLFASPPPFSHSYAVIHPTAAMPYKVWPPERFVAVAEHLARARSLEPVIIGAATDDLTPFRQYRTLAGAPLAEVKSLLSGAALFVGNDSGPAHIAAAFGVPVIVLFGRLDHQVIWAPWKASASRTFASAKGIADVPLDGVIQAIDELATPASDTSPASGERNDPT